MINHALTRANYIRKLVALVNQLRLIATQVGGDKKAINDLEIEIQTLAADVQRSLIKQILTEHERSEGKSLDLSKQFSCHYNQRDSEGRRKRRHG